MSWNSSNWNANNWNQNYWWLGGAAASGGVFVVVGGPALASAYTEYGTLYTSSVVGVTGGVSQASGYTYNPGFGISAQVSTSVAYVSGLTYNPSVRIIVLPNTQFVTGSTNAPTLSIGSTLFVGTIVATGRTYRPFVSDGTGIPEDFTGTTEILDSYPALRKGTLDVNGDNVAIVLAGQIGLNAGDVLIYLGNGQWRRR